MGEQQVSREEFQELWEAYQDLAKDLSEKDRHQRGGTTMGEIFNSPGVAEAWISVLSDPAYIRYHVAFMLEVWLGNRDEWGVQTAKLASDLRSPPGIAALGKGSPKWSVYADPVQLGRRAARHRSMTAEKARNRIADLEDAAQLCGSLAEAFEQRLADEAGLRRLK